MLLMGKHDFPETNELWLPQQTAHRAFMLRVSCAALTSSIVFLVGSGQSASNQEVLSLASHFFTLFQKEQIVKKLDK